MAKLTQEQVKKLRKGELELIVLTLQDQIDQLSKNVEYLTEQIRVANSQRFGRHTEKLDVLCDGQLSFFDEVENTADGNQSEPEYEEVVVTRRRVKKPGKREEDFKDIPTDNVPIHDVSKEELDAFFGEGNYKKLPDEHYDELIFQPATWLHKFHTVAVYVGTGGEHQDEFLRGKHPKTLLRGSIVTPSLGSAIMNAKFVNSVPLYRIEQEFERDGVNISRQTMANWVINLSERYLQPVWDRLKESLLSFHVNQCDETPTLVLEDKSTDSDSQLGYMWVHRNGEFYKDRQIVLYQYNKSRAHTIPLEFYKGFKGVLETDGLSQYHLLEKKQDGLISANCWAHARRDLADAIKALDKKKVQIQSTIAYQALERIGKIYKIEESLKDLTPEARLRKRQEKIKPLVEEFFEWAKEAVLHTLPKSKTATGLAYCINQEKYLKVFLEDGEVPIDNSASERSIRPFCVGKKNWLFINSLKGAHASAVVYSITETAKANNLSPYRYLEYLLEKMPYLIEKDGTVKDISKLDELLPWSKSLPENCFKKRRT